MLLCVHRSVLPLRYTTIFRSAPAAPGAVDGPQAVTVLAVPAATGDPPDWPYALDRPAAPAAAPRPVRLVPFRSEEHKSELQSRFDIVCSLLYEKKNYS